MKLKCILLIDDDEPTNYLNKLILEEMDCAEHIEVAQSAKEAIDFLTDNHSIDSSDELISPDLVFLDINMPAVDGWEFLDLFKAYNRSNQKKAITVMLTTSLNPDDESRSINSVDINAFRRKPLSKQMVREIIEKYFEN